MATTETPTKVVIPEARLSYLNAFEPRAALDEGDKAKYGASLLIDKSDTATIKKIEKAVAAAVALGKTKFGAKWRATKQPLRDGDEEREDDETYQDMYFINASSVQKPVLVDEDRNLIIDRADLKSGDYATVSVNFFPFKSKSSGVACGLNAIMKTRDGESLGGAYTVDMAMADFDDVPAKRTTKKPAKKKVVEDEDDDWPE